MPIISDFKNFKISTISKDHYCSNFISKYYKCKHIYTKKIPFLSTQRVYYMRFHLEISIPPTALEKILKKQS